MKLVRHIVLATVLFIAAGNAWGQVPEDSAPAGDTPQAPAPDDAPKISTSAADKALASRLAKQVEEGVLPRARIGVWVARMRDDEPLFERHGDELFVPASTSKLVTAAAALHHLGPAFRFETEVFLDSGVAREVPGTLYFQGHGDPTIDTATLAYLAQAVTERDIRRIKGGVCADGSAFDGEVLAPGFDKKDTDATYRSAVAATAVHGASVRVAVYPGPAPGEPCRLWFEVGSGYLTVTNRCKTVGGKGNKVTLSTQGTDEGTRLVVGGTLGTAAGRVVARRRIAHPLLQAAHALSEALSGAGIAVDAEPRRCEHSGTRRLLIHRSDALGHILRDMNKRSDNFIAEMLFKTVGAKVVGGTATWEKASRAVRSFFRSVDETLGGEPIFGDGSYTFQNGSGLYDVNRLSPHQLARVLRYAAGHPEWGSDFAASLPIAGRDGTLKRRMRKGAAAHRARGKTGSLNGVDALAGIVSDKDGTAWIYVFLANDVKAPHREVRRAMDGLVETIAGHQAGR